MLISAFESDLCNADIYLDKSQGLAIRSASAGRQNRQGESLKEKAQVLFQWHRHPIWIDHIIPEAIDVRLCVYIDATFLELNS